MSFPIITADQRLADPRLPRDPATAPENFCGNGLFVQMLSGTEAALSCRDAGAGAGLFR